VSSTNSRAESRINSRKISKARRYLLPTLRYGSGFLGALVLNSLALGALSPRLSQPPKQNLAAPQYQIDASAIGVKFQLHRDSSSNQRKNKQKNTEQQNGLPKPVSSSPKNRALSADKKALEKVIHSRASTKHQAFPPAPIITSKQIEIANKMLESDIADTRITQDQTSYDEQKISERNKPSQESSSASPSQEAVKPELVEQLMFAHPPTPPRYPAIAKKRGQQGKVLLELWLNESGQQSHLTIAKSSGFEVLDNAALKAVAHWQFKAHSPDGFTRVASRIRVPIEFALN